MKTPKLSKRIVRDDLALGDAIIAVLTRSGGAGSSRRPSQLQRRLQRAVEPKAWKVYLHLEEIVHERESHEEDLLVRWAFEQGRRYERRR